MKWKLGLFAIALATLVVFGSTPVEAAIMYNLNVGNTGGISSYPPSYGTVTVDLTDSTHATITFTGGDPAGPYYYLFGGQGALAVNVSTTAFTVSSITGMDMPQLDLNQNESDFGLFNLTIDNRDGNGAAGTPMSFVLTRTSGTWASEFSVLAPNAGGYSVAAHIFVRNSDNGSNPATGYAGNGGPPEIITPPEVPEPVSLAIWGIGLGLAGVVGMRKRKLQRA